MLRHSKHPQIWLPRYHDVGLVAPHARVAGRYQLAVGRRGEPPRQVTEWCDNLILNAGLDRLCGTALIADRISIGTSNTAPDVSQTGLLGHLATSTTPTTAPSNTRETESPYSITNYIARRFAEGVGTGNIAEVGAGWATNTLFSRALVVDGGGSPTTITKLADEILDVTYSLTMYPPLTDAEYSISISGTSHDVITRAAAVTNTALWFHALHLAPLSAGFTAYDGNIGAITGVPSGSSSSSTTGYTPSYTAGTYTLTYAQVVDTTHGNFGTGLRSIRIGQLTNGRVNYQHQFDPVIAKDATKRLTLNGSVSFARYTP